MNVSRRRRTVVRAACAVFAGSVAGCVGTDSSDDDASQSEPATESSETTATTTATTTETEGSPTVEEYLSDTDNFDGVVDRTGRDAVGVEVGVEANGAFFGFGPPAVRVDRGTTVTWTWTGQGGVHNVIARHGAEFESDLSSQEGNTFQQTFDETGTVLYACNPHEGTGMKGAIVVE
jgi:halocyanin-like protein